MVVGFARLTPHAGQLTLLRGASQLCSAGIVPFAPAAGQCPGNCMAEFLWHIESKLEPRLVAALERAGGHRPPSNGLGQINRVGGVHFGTEGGDLTSLPHADTSGPGRLPARGPRCQIFPPLHLVSTELFR